MKYIEWLYIHEIYTKANDSENNTASEGRPFGAQGSDIPLDVMTEEVEGGGGEGGRWRVREAEVEQDLRGGLRWF